MYYIYNSSLKWEDFDIILILFIEQQRLKTFLKLFLLIFFEFPNNKKSE